jgi:phosphatidylinositol alpha-1,6-mannosyltransferase
VLLPTASLARRIRHLSAEVGATLVVLDPALPLSLIGPRLELPYVVVVHGAEVSVPGRMVGTRQLLRRALVPAVHVLACGEFVLAEVRRVVGPGVRATIVPPGVDITRFRPLSGEARRAARVAHDLPVDGRLVVSVSRLVPRKGMDVLIAAASLLQEQRPDLNVAIAGSGRDADRLGRLVAATGAPVRLLGRVPDAALPALVGCGDVFAVPCRRRWAGLEQEGFGIVFLEAAACGLPQVAGDSGGAGEAVVHGQTGIVVRSPDDPAAVADALAVLLDDEDVRKTMGEAALDRATTEFEYGRLATKLDETLRGLE